MPVTPARRIAFDILLRVETGEAYASDLLHAKLTGHGEGADPAAAGKGEARKTKRSIRREDAALATELVMGALRQERLLDYLIERQARRATASLDPEVRIPLRLGLYQLRFLARVPPSAAVNEAVELAKRGGKRSAAALVNAVLRAMLRESPRRPAEAVLPGNLSAPERLAILYSHPEWLVERWLARFGRERAEALLAADNRAPRLALALHRVERRAEIVAELERSGLRVEASAWLHDALVVSGGSPVATEAWRRGWMAPQDEASQMVPRLLDARPGERLLDLGAAPGGKTLALAAAAGPANIVAADLHPHRLRAMGELLARAGAGDVRRVALDATAPLPFAAAFDRILLDAPCSGTGTLARHPEIRKRLRPAELAEFAARQAAMLARAAVALAPGGRLVYSTCSLEPEENEEVVARVLAGRTDLARVDAPRLRQALAPHLAEGADPAALIGDDGCLRTFPDAHGTDGFFAAAIEKKEGNHG
jgi:16S rRNA (cytosine967-C5)-methyltransferase